MKKQQPTKTEEPELQYLPMDFTNPATGETYRYDYDRLSTDQCEFAEEVMEWKREQLQKGASTFNEITRSGGAEWLSTVASYLLVPVQNGIAQKFDEGRVYETQRFVKALPAKEYQRLKGCVTDFFTAMGKQSAISQLLQNRNGVNAKDILFQLMTANLKDGASNPSA